MKQIIRFIACVVVFWAVCAHAQTPSQRVVFTSSNPPVSCTAGKLYSNSVTHKLYQGTSTGTCTDVTGGATFDPNDVTTLYVRDDFIGGNGSGGTIGELSWSASSATAAPTLTVVEGTYPRFGQIKVETDTTANHDANIYLGTPSGSIAKLGNLAANTNWDAYWIASLGSTALIRARFGFCYQMLSGVLPTDGIWIGYDTSNSDTNYVYETRAASTSTRTASAVAADTNFHKFRIRSTSAGTILFSVDGGSETGIATNVTTQNITPCAIVTTTTTAVKGFTADFFSFKATGLTR